ncbi:MAG TPA: substrate-binding domain-containing protein, partial [Vicinamibacterales bacterium]|nr:substrate-binding domain-containing protein [Vicinamibacterales bacterium]
MRMLRRCFVALALIGAVACGGAGGGTTTARPPTSSRKVVGVTLLTQTDAFYKALEAGIRQEAAAKGLDVVVVACEYDPTKQASQIEDFVAQHVAAILAAPCDSDAIVPALAGAEQAGIPVFTADIAAHGGKIASHVAS